MRFPSMDSGPAMAFVQISHLLGICQALLAVLLRSLVAQVVQQRDYLLKE
jgi:hypothetical protein